MQVCPRCNNFINDGDKYCKTCGYRLPEEEKEHSSIQIKGIVIAIIIAAIIIAAAKYAYDLYAENKYKSKVEICAYTMLEGAADAEDACNKMIAVWNNSIWGIDDPETDEFTKDRYGNFYDDFNDALYKLIQDPEYADKLRNINDNLHDVNSRMIELQNPPKRCQQLHDVFMDFYDEYYILVNCAIDPSGNLNSFSDKFSAADEKSAQLLKKLEVYFE